jgi:Uncharacterized conserved protein (DUF2303).
MDRNTTIAGGADAIKELTALAAQARGIDIAVIKAPEGLRGVPAEAPVGIRHGTQPEAFSLASLFEAYRTRPAAKKGTATALTLRSFIALTNRHKTVHSAIFADTSWRAPSFTAVIDYHELHIEAGDEAAVVVGQPDNGKHRIRYDFPLSEEWKEWIKFDGERMGQGDFAAFLEDRITELSSPTDAERNALERDFATRVATPAELVTLSRGLQVNVEAQVKNAVTLQTGEGQIVWEETHKDADGKPVKVPGIFLLNIAPFFKGEKIRIPVRLRYRPAGGKLTWFYQIYRPDQYVTERVRDDLLTVAAETGLPTFEGAPEMSA